jgi:hypothetical protein
MQTRAGRALAAVIMGGNNGNDGKVRGVSGAEWIARVV